MLDQLINTIQKSLIKQDTHHPLFHGSWDWHSAVHGHWALLHYARIENDTFVIKWLEKRFSNGKILLEIDYLNEHPNFERPYGRAWFLAMIIAYHQAGFSPDLSDASNRLAVDLWNWLKIQSPNTSMGEYNNQCWTLLQLYRWFAFTGDNKFREDIQKWVNEHCWSIQNHPTQDQTRQEFFSPWGIQTLLLYQVFSASDVHKWLARQRYSPATVRPITPGKKVHHLGMNATRGWGCWAAWKATSDTLWKRAYQAHLDASFALHINWKNDHFSYAHWVPQFTLYGHYIDSIHADLGGNKFSS